ncbi:hypothetical protein COY95_02560 [Candidatus Woesearchaeota archaeon CG_4_10_14_0_8_um_filter_47_5]|nr:MAG: hypothetical protein COY95_02560 [Candidatus Woesearchaeota archaeon CG_4_10_14_0_8_um_filter_47_5]
MGILYTAKLTGIGELTKEGMVFTKPQWWDPGYGLERALELGRGHMSPLSGRRDLSDRAILFELGGNHIVEYLPGEHPLFQVYHEGRFVKTVTLGQPKEYEALDALRRNLVQEYLAHYLAPFGKRMAYVPFAGREKAADACEALKPQEYLH